MFMRAYGNNAQTGTHLQEAFFVFLAAKSTDVSPAEAVEATLPEKVARK